MVALLGYTVLATAEVILNTDLEQFAEDLMLGVLLLKCNAGVLSY